MNPASLPRARPVCHSCRNFLKRPTSTTHTHSILPIAAQHRWLSQSTQPSLNTTSIAGSLDASSRLPRRQIDPARSLRQDRRLITTTSARAAENGDLRPAHPERLDLTRLHTRVEELATTILEHPAVPSEEDVLRALEEYQTISHALLSQKDTTPAVADSSTNNTATSALLSSVKKTHSAIAVTKSELLDLLSDRAFDIMRHAPVFITTPILKAYISLQAALSRPESFPDVFDMYRSKPVPRPTKTHPITYTEQNSDKPAAAVPPAIADAAIEAAIAVRDLPLALATIETTYCTTAYKRSKFLRSALFPLAGLVLTPPAAYTLASRFSDWQTTMDSSTATQVAMAGILTYTTAVATVGYVALTTANDQMVRVTWATGLPLWERWVREEERGAVDKVAQAWGFKSKDKWGEEEGSEWLDLREWIGLRGMMLDRVELMDGME